MLTLVISPVGGVEIRVIFVTIFLFVTTLALCVGCT